MLLDRGEWRGALFSKARFRRDNLVDSTLIFTCISFLSFNFMSLKFLVSGMLLALNFFHCSCILDCACLGWFVLRRVHGICNGLVKVCLRLRVRGSGFELSFCNPYVSLGDPLFLTSG